MELLMKIAGFDKTEIEFFSNLYIRLEAADKELLSDLEELFMSSKGMEVCTEIKEKLKPLYAKYGVDTKCIYMLFFVSCLERLKATYAAKGLDESLYYDIIKDLKYKLDECKRVHGVVGSMSFEWYYKIFNAETISLGRFQYHTDQFYDTQYRWKDIVINPGDPVVSFHIPSSGSMTKEMRIDSYKKAFEFFGKKKGEYLILTCSSWLLDPVNRSVFPAGSNLADFMDDFDIIETYPAEAEKPFTNAWRVFGMHYTGDTGILPAKTTLQRNYIKLLKEGKSVGSGIGVIIFDGEKIVNQ